MRKARSPHASVHPRTRLGPVAALISAVFLLGLAGSASATPLIGKEGRIHACYRVKGKPKGSLRVVGSAHARCRHGERKVSWVAVGAAGQAGAPGSAGAPGAPGAPGGDSQLLERITDLEAQVTDLGEVLQGVTNVGLLAAIGDVPKVAAVCSQAASLTSQLNSVEAAVGNIGLNTVLKGLGGALEIPSLPTALTSFTCP